MKKRIALIDTMTEERTICDRTIEDKAFDLLEEPFTKNDKEYLKKGFLEAQTRKNEELMQLRNENAELKEQLRIIDFIGLRTISWFMKNILGHDIWFWNDGFECIDCYSAIGIEIKHDTFEKTKLEFHIITDSCWTFDIRKYQKEWFLNEEEALRKTRKMMAIADDHAASDQE